MYIVRLSLFCAAALLVNGAYANEFTGSAGASAKTTEFIVSASPRGEASAGVQPQGYSELRQQASRAARDDGQWLRISDDGESDTANREPRPSADTPRWVF